MLSELMEKRMDLTLQLRDIEALNENRKHLISLCVVRGVSLCRDLKDTQVSGKNVPSPKKMDSKVVEKTSNSVVKKTDSGTAPKDFEVVQKKLLSYEVQVAHLKSQLSTKEQAYEAKIDELKDQNEMLKSEIRVSNGKSNMSTKDRIRFGKKNGKLLSISPLSLHTRSIPSFFAKSPFSESKSGKGNSFSGDGIASLASQASLKLSKGPSKASEDVFSPNNSSAESTPKKATSQSDIFDNTVTGKAAESETEKSSNINLTVSDPEETFQSANATFESEKGKRPKKRKIRLISAEASKLILASQEKDHNNEAEDLNSLKYYQDENFENESVTPIRLQTRPSTSEPILKKRHVFKIGDDSEAE